MPRKHTGTACFLASLSPPPLAPVPVLFQSSHKCLEIYGPPPFLRQNPFSTPKINDKRLLEEERKGDGSGEEKNETRADIVRSNLIVGVGNIPWLGPRQETLFGIGCQELTLKKNLLFIMVCLRMERSLLRYRKKRGLGSELPRKRENG